MAKRGTGLLALLRQTAAELCPQSNSPLQQATACCQDTAARSLLPAGHQAVAGASAKQVLYRPAALAYSARSDVSRQAGNLWHQLRALQSVRQCHPSSRTVIAGAATGLPHRSLHTSRPRWQDPPAESPARPQAAKPPRRSRPWRSKAKPTAAKGDQPVTGAISATVSASSPPYTPSSPSHQAAAPASLARSSPRSRGRPKKAAAAAAMLQPDPSQEATSQHAADGAASAAAGSSDPPRELPSYKELQARAGAKGKSALPLLLQPEEKAHIKRVLMGFIDSPAVKDQALSLYVNSQLYKVAKLKFVRLMKRGIGAALRDELMRVDDGPAAQQLLFPYFAQFAVDKYAQQIQEYRELVGSVDLRKPYLWYPVARALRRRFIYHAGPTNSGKTYTALEAMKAAREGVYCGPLRLLAMEVADACNARGTYCHLVTGQERKEVPGARHTSCTIEMANLRKPVDVAVIDEIQMIGDEQRGWAWTRVLQGMPANEIHLCGDASAVGLVRQLCEAMGEEVEVVQYERFSTLQVEQGGLQGAYQGIQPGDCVVAFSRRNIFEIKQLIEQETGHRVCVVYGALPPEMRRLQARLFNEPDSGYSVLVASDAVGMGLNLNIRRIIFHTLVKFEGGEATAPVSVSAIKQIAGRAGRRNSPYPEGRVACRSGADVPRLQQALAVRLENMTTATAGLFPEFEHLEVFAGKLPEASFSALLTRFGEEARLDGTYFFCNLDPFLRIAKLLERVGELSLEARYRFCMAPVNHRDSRALAALLNFAAKYAQKEPVMYTTPVPARAPRSPDELKHLESSYQILALWLWLSNRFEEDSFPGREFALKAAEQLIALMDRGLEQITAASVQRMVSGKRRRKELYQQSSDGLFDGKRGSFGSMQRHEEQEPAGQHFVTPDRSWSDGLLFKQRAQAVS